MKYLILFLLSLPLFFLFPQAVLALEGDLIWNKVNNYSTFHDYMSGVAVDSTGLYVTGFDYALGSNNGQWRVEKKSLSNGSPIWAKTLNLSAWTEAANGVAVDSTGVYIVGSDSSAGSGQWRIEKRSLVDGSIVWAQSVNFSASADAALEIKVDNTGVYVVGYDASVDISQWRMQKRSLSDGTLLWSQASNPTVGGDQAIDVVVDGTGIYVVGTYMGLPQMRIEKRDLATGNLIWQQNSNPTSSYEYSTAVEIDSTGVYMIGYDTSVDNYWRLEKRDLATGNLIWQQNSNPSSNISIVNASAIDESGIYMVGEDSGSDVQWRIEKRSLTNGALTWIKYVNPSIAGNYEDARGVAVDNNGIYVIGGDNSPTNLQWRIEKRALTDCTVTGTGGRLTAGSAIHKIEAVNGNQLKLYHNGLGDPSPFTFTFTNCGTISGNVSMATGTPIYGIGDGNTISIRDANATSTVYGTINFSYGSSIIGDFSGLAGGSSPVISSSGNSLFTVDTGTLIMTFDYAPPPICTGPISISWTDPTITANTTKIRKVHIDELRTWIDNRRSDAGLAAYSWTDQTLMANTTKIRKVHFDDLRTAINQVYAACGQVAPIWTDSALTANSTKIRAVHITELRSAVSNAP